jgi:hypothetical protein
VTPESENNPETIEIAEEIETVTQESGSTPTDPGASASPEAEVTTPIAPQTPDVAPEMVPAKNRAARAKKAPDAVDTGGPREGSKTSQVIAMLKREGGATLEEIMTAMGWQKHTTRSMLSASAKSGFTLSRHEPNRVLSFQPPDSNPAAFLLPAGGTPARRLGCVIHQYRWPFPRITSQSTWGANSADLESRSTYQQRACYVNFDGRTNSLQVSA